MKVGIISDTHDRIDNLSKVINILHNKGCEELIHCGDLCSPFMISILEGFHGKVHCVLGNVGDPHVTLDRAMQAEINFEKDLLELEIERKKIAVIHYPKLAEALAYTKKYDIVFYGHNHMPYKEKIGYCWLVNPGELMGWKGKPCFAIYDTETNNVEHFVLN